jgi:hypothetical protein
MLEDAAKYIQKLPKAEQQLAEWQAAVEAMLLVVERNGPTMMARIGFMRALAYARSKSDQTPAKAINDRWGAGSFSFY